MTTEDATVDCLIKESENKENTPSTLGGKGCLVPTTNNDATASSGEALTKVRRKAPRVPPLTLPAAPPSISPTPEEFHLPPYLASVPSSNTTFNMFTPISLPMTPPFTPNLPPPPFARQPQLPPISALVEMPGFINFKLRHDMVISISSNFAIKLKNVNRQSNISVSSCSSQMAVVHPKGRLLQYGERVEVQVEDMISVKNAKIFPRGISFTANNMALVYLLDQAGARSTSDMFHDLDATEIAETLFLESIGRQVDGITESIRLLDNTRYWRTNDNIDCWKVGPIFIQQTDDGLVIVEKEAQQGKKISLRSSPSNGKVKLDSQFVQMTASLGSESHMFLRSTDRRLHYNGESKVFTVRNAGHSAGFDHEGSFRIF